MKNTTMHTSGFLCLGVFLCGALGFSQDGMRNVGNMKLFEQSEMGIHINLVNDGSFDENLGRVGFFNEDDYLSISGAFRPVFYDMEVMVADDLILEVGLGVTNNMNLILGDVTTPRTFSDVNVDFMNNSFYTGQSDSTKIDGYAAITNKKNFTFPVGYRNQLKPLQLLSDEVNTSAKCAYFYEDPNAPTSIPSAFPTAQRTVVLTAVSPYEFWDLDASISSRVKLFWNQNSKLENFIDRLESLRVVGWHLEKEAWLNLGITMISGDLQSGTIISDAFNPEEYKAITFGNLSNSETANLANYLLTPNGDGVNDVLFLEAISLSPDNNTLRIYNRWGRLVYMAEGYQNDFNGTANTEWVVERNVKLPNGVYFYLLELWDIDLSHQGYLAISN